MRKVFCLVLLFSSVSWAQSPADLRFLPAPSLFSPLNLPAQALLYSDGTYEFGKMDQELFSHKVLLLGESHWMHEIHQLLTDLVLYANTRDYYPLLVLEVPYSATAYINAYLNADSVAAQQYVPAIKPIMKAKESWRLLRTLRAWNVEHPNKKITVACSDIEQGLGYCLKYVFDPYFKALGEQRLWPMLTQAQDLTPQIQAFMDSVLRAAPADFKVPDAPFLNRAFVNNVWINTKASLAANRAMQESGYEAFAQIRAERIFQNLTDDAFFGKKLKADKTILWGGADHTKIYDPNPGEGTLRWEGWRLAHEFGPTKGNVYAIRVTNFAYAIPANYYQPEAYTRATESFVQLVDLFKKDVPGFTPDRYLILDELTDVSAALAQQSQRQNNLPVWINHAALREAARQQPNLRNDAVWQNFVGYDTVIVMPQTTLFDYGN
ncbi:hypothetical protein [Salmonirosea aquatica]|uniref:Erythromycin esterase family protein n=1 Tax=Salmonirosea aquatica TaxID=2654236 RepID=A0A7C9FTH9_9BACT|nr:hypothetical protein [Cytophagaceae bacterium SJW1-29]